MSNKDIRRTIRYYKKLKRQLRPGTPQRLDLCHRIKALKIQLKEQNYIAPERASLIQRIIKVSPISKYLEKSFWQKFSLEQLEFHLQKITK